MSMVRSIASDSSSACSVDLWSSASESEGSDAAARARAEEAQQARRRDNTRAWLKRRFVCILCEMAVEEQLQRTGCTSRQLAGRLSSFRRRCQGHDLEGLLVFTGPQLDDAAADALQRDADVVLSQYDEPVPENDYHWIYSEQVGGHEHPQRHQVEQTIQQLLLRSLRPQLRTASSEIFIQRAVTAAGGCLYRDSIMLLWPLLSSADRFAFQQWYQGRPVGLPEPPASARGVDDFPEPARGSCDPDPRQRARAP